jgi:hypothetical protein
VEPDASIRNDPGVTSDKVIRDKRREAYNELKEKTYEAKARKGKDTRGFDWVPEEYRPEAGDPEKIKIGIPREKPRTGADPRKDPRDLKRRARRKLGIFSN